MSAAPAFTFDSVVPFVPFSVTVSFALLSYTTASDSPVTGSITPPFDSESSRSPTRVFVANSCEPFTASLLVADRTPSATLCSATGAVAPVPPSVTLSFAAPSYVTASDVSLPAPSSPTRPVSFNWPRFSAS